LSHLTCLVPSSTARHTVHSTSLTALVSLSPSSEDKQSMRRVILIHRENPLAWNCFHVISFIQTICFWSIRKRDLRFSWS
jgi:predicted oxidoreductase (fatty acid repression mutant protein)